jgi:hypothetical protein
MMKAWGSGSLTVYHGTDTWSLSAFHDLSLGRHITGFEVDLGKSRVDAEFGLGFYVTTRRVQAREWANNRVRRRKKGQCRAVLLEFQIDWNWLASLDALCFARPSLHFWSFVEFSRAGSIPHGRAGPKKAFDVVYGPVTINDYQVISDADQISFHTATACKGIPEPLVVELGEEADGMFKKEVRHGVVD